MSWNLEEAVSYYRRQGAPGDQSALIALLKEIQTQSGGSVPPAAITAAAQAYGVKESLFHGLIRRIPSLRLGDGHILELCAGPNCGRHQSLAAMAEKLCAQCCANVTLKYTGCMRQCGKGPNLKWDGKLYHKADEKLLRSLLEQVGK